MLQLATCYLRLTKVFSKKRKKNTTDNNVPTRSNRLDPVADTLTASTWIVTDSEMRVAILSSSDTNASSPFLEPASSTALLTNASTSSTPREVARCVASALTLAAPFVSEEACQRPTMDLAAVINTTTATSTAASSSLRIPSSLAASTSSLAITNETDTDRSDEIAEMEAVSMNSDLEAARRAVAASQLLVPRKADVRPSNIHTRPCLSSPTTLISNSVLLRASTSYLTFAVNKCTLKLHVLELFLSSTNGASGTKRSHSGAQRHTGFHDVTGLCMGCCLGSIVELLRSACPKSQPAHIVQSIQTTLVSCAMALRSTGGGDVDALTAGMASGHMCRGQLLQISQRRVLGKLHSRHGNSATAIGCTVAVIGIATYLAQTHSDYTELERSILALIKETDSSMGHSIIRQGGNAMSKTEIKCIQAEQRAMQRARCGFIAAGCVSNLERLCGRDRLFLCISWASKAAFPPGDEIDVDSHEAMLEKLSSAQFYVQPVLARPIPIAKPPTPSSQVGIVPLSEIQHSLCTPRAFADDDSSVTWSSLSSLSSSIGSAPSVASDDATPRVAAFSKVGLEKRELGLAGVEVHFCQLLFS